MREDLLKANSNLEQNMIRFFFLLGYLILTGCKSVPLGVENVDNYKLAHESILKDVDLRAFCETDTLQIAVFNGFRYQRITYFIDSLKQDGVTNEKFNRLRKLEQNASKKHQLNGYIQMERDFHQSFDVGNSPCLIICFDRIRDSYISAEVAEFSEEENWKSVVSFKPSWLILFDTSTKPVKYYKIKITR